VARASDGRGREEHRRPVPDRHLVALLQLRASFPPALESSRPRWMK
jgi:hypothetical protein